MSFDRSILARNEAERKRVQTYIAGSSDDELCRPLGDGWTVAAVLAHLAFWDRRALVLVERWERTGISASPADAEAINLAALPQWLVIPPGEARREWLAAAEAIDRELADLPAEVIERIAAHPETINLERAEHRKHHLAQIERARARG